LWQHAAQNETGWKEKNNQLEVAVAVVAVVVWWQLLCNIVAAACSTKWNWLGKNQKQSTRGGSGQWWQWQWWQRWQWRWWRGSSCRATSSRQHAVQNGKWLKKEGKNQPNGMMTCLINGMKKRRKKINPMG